MKNYQLVRLSRKGWVNPVLEYRQSRQGCTPVDTARHFCIRGFIFALFAAGIIVFSLKNLSFLKTINPVSLGVPAVLIMSVAFVFSDIMGHSKFGSALSRLCRILNCSYEQLAKMKIQEIEQGIACAVDGQALRFVSRRQKASVSPSVIMSKSSIEMILEVCIDLDLDLDKTHVRSCVQSSMDKLQVDPHERAIMWKELPKLLAA